MPPSDSRASSQQQLLSEYISNQNNHGIIGNGYNNIVNSCNITNEINHTKDELEKLLDGLLSKDALHDSFYSPQECHSNTRVTIRNEVGEWIDESGSEKSSLLWLNGPAAVGKSVIAKTVSSFHGDQIVATFFFSTSSDRSAATLFPTLAWQLARRIPDTREHIIASLKKNRSLQTSQIEAQFDLLIIQPLKKSTTMLRSRPVMVIDGVDECTDESILVRFLRALVQASEGGHHNMPVRVIVCSRPEPRIRAILGQIRYDNTTTDGQELQSPSLIYRSLGFVFRLIASIAFISSSLSEALYRLRSDAHLHTPIQRNRGFLQEVWELYKPIQLGVDKPQFTTSGELADTLDRICPHPVISTIQIGFSEECKEDIARYLTDRFNAICQRGESSSPWFQPCDISDLVEASCGQFLYASTIVRLLDEFCFDPKDVLKMARRHSLPTPDLNKLYKAILKRTQDTIRHNAKEGGPKYQTEWRFLIDSLAIVVFFAENDHFFAVRKSFLVIETLLGIERGKLALKLSKMHSVLRIVPGETIQVHHRSFLEFLQNRERSGEYYIGHLRGLRWISILMTRAWFRYRFVHPHRQFELGCVQDMVTETRRHFFRRSRFPFILEILHLSVHFSFMLSLFMLCSFLLSKYSSPLLSIMLLFLTFNGIYTISLTIYTSFLNRSVLVPFFHPFLHPFFSFMYGFFTLSQHQSTRSPLRHHVTARSLQAPKDKEIHMQHFPNETLKQSMESILKHTAITASSSVRQIQRDLVEIPSEYFPIWGQTLGYDQGLPHFRLLPEFCEEGVLIPTAEGYSRKPFQRIHNPGVKQEKSDLEKKWSHLSEFDQDL